MLALPRIIVHDVGTSSVHRVRRMFGVRHQTKNYALYFACQVSFLESTYNLETHGTAPFHKCGSRTVLLPLEIFYNSNHLSSKRRACVLTQLPWLPRAPSKYARNVLGETEEMKQCSEACATTLRHLLRHYLTTWAMPLLNPLLRSQPPPGQLYPERATKSEPWLHEITAKPT